MQKMKAYPKADAVRSGCKVSWYFYTDRKIADKAAAAAKHNGMILEDRGYDFGYQVPGYLSKATWDGRDGWEVTIP
jgi:hypothetical protein